MVVRRGVKNLWAVKESRQDRFGPDGKRWSEPVVERLTPQEIELFEAVRSAKVQDEVDMDSDLSILLNNEYPNVNCLNYGQSPLYLAASRGNLGVVTLLLRWPHHEAIDVNLCNDDGATPFYVACRGGYLEIAKLLLKKGADPNLATSDGRSPLWIAAYFGRVHLLRWLIDAVPGDSLDWDRRAQGIDNGTTPEDVARLRKHPRALALLELGKKRAGQDRARDRLLKVARSAKVAVRIRDAPGLFFGPDGDQSIFNVEIGREYHQLGDPEGIDFGGVRAKYARLEAAQRTEGAAT